MAEKAAKKAAVNEAPAKKSAAKNTAAEKTAPEMVPAKKAPLKKAPAKDAAAKKAAPAESPQDAMRRKFREALEHKHGHQTEASRGHESGHGPALRSNDKRQQMFRRKSGG